MFGVQKQINILCLLLVLMMLSILSVCTGRKLHEYLRRAVILVHIRVKSCINHLIVCFTDPNVCIILHVRCRVNRVSVNELRYITNSVQSRSEEQLVYF